MKYQEIDVFGASLTDSSAWLLAHKLSNAQREDALEMLFSPAKGIGLSVLRQPMGSSEGAEYVQSIKRVSGDSGLLKPKEDESCKRSLVRGKEVPDRRIFGTEDPRAETL